MRAVDAPRSRAMFERGLEVIPGGNTRSAVYFPPFPLYMDRGHGARIVDVDGVERIDFVNCNSAAVHGHGHPAIVAAVREQAERLLCAGMPTAGEVRLAELLCSRVPSIEQLRLANSGTEALMYAVRVARAATGRIRIARVEGTYHGSYDPMYVSVRPLAPEWGVREAPTPVPYTEGLPPTILDEVLVLPFNDVDATRRLLEQHGAELACILVDPCPSYLAFLPAAPEYLSLLRQQATAAGCLLVFDEVISFRLAFNGAQGYFGVSPDLTALGKLIGGGLPVGALGGRRDLMAFFDHRFGHARVEQSGTFSGNPMTCAAGIAALEALDHSAIEQMNTLGERLRAGLRTALAASGVTGQVRGLASMAALLFHDEDYSDYRSLVRATARPGVMARAAWMHRWWLDHGIAAVPQGAMFLSTAMSAADIDEVLAVTQAGLLAMAQLPPAEFGCVA